MILDAHNIYTVLSESTEEERIWLSQILSVEDPTAAFLGVEKTTNLFDGEKFPTGLIRRVVKACPFQTTINDKRLKPAQAPLPVPGGWLRDYQIEAVQQAHKRTRGVICLPTGAGKTEIAIALSDTLPGRWLFLADEVDVVENARSRFEKHRQQPVGRIGDSTTASFTVSTFQTIWHKLKEGDPAVAALLAGVDGILVDECHSVPAETYLGILLKCQAYWRFGMSATAFYGNALRNLLIEGALGPSLINIPIKELIRQGVLAAPQINLVECFQHYRVQGLTSPAKRAAAYRQVKTNLLVNSAMRNALIAEVAKAATKPTIVFTEEVEHAKLVLKQLREIGVVASLVTGSTRKRETKIAELQNGELQAVVTTVFKQGVDIPKLRSVVLGGAGKSPVSLLQKIGRGTRKVDDKVDFEVWDIWDQGSMLDNQSEARLDLYEQEGFQIFQYVYDAHLGLVRQR